MANDAQKKALDILLESLKLYITISTIFIAGLISLYASSKVHNFSLYVSIAGFILCALISVYNYNYYIREVNNDTFDIEANHPKWVNRSAILFFLVGLGFGVTFVFKNDLKRTSSELQIIINSDTLSINKTNMERVILKTDSLNKINEIEFVPFK